MKRNLVYILFSIILFAGFTFSQDDQKTATKEKTSTNKKIHMEKKNTSTDSFVKEAASGGMMEVELGKYAKDNASSEDVKNFGDMMVTDHSKANDELKDALKKTNLEPNKEMLKQHQSMYDKLAKLKGSDFDKAYMKMMVEDHKKDVKAFEKASKNEKNADIKSWAANTLPTLKKHLQKAEEINKNLKSTKVSKKTMK